MPDTFDHVVYLAQEIGPRPAGTEEEQQAALYIADTIQQEAGLHAEVEDFRSKSDGTAVKCACGVIGLLLTILAIIFPVMAIPSIVITVIGAVIVVLENMGKTFISNLIPGTASQNIVAKYIPENATEPKRKIVVVAHYDTDKVQRAGSARLLAKRPAIDTATSVAFILLPLFLLVRGIFFLNTTGAIAIVVNVVVVLTAVFTLIPLIFFVMKTMAPYNDGANCNASGVAVLIDAATRVGSGVASYAGDEYVDGASKGGFVPIVHGKEAAREAGVVPEGAELIYDEAGEQTFGKEAANAMNAGMGSAESFDVGEDANPEDRLLAAKRAIAALTGKPVSMTVNIDFAKQQRNEAQWQDEPAYSEQDYAEAGMRDEAVLLEGDERPVMAQPAPAQNEPIKDAEAAVAMDVASAQVAEAVEAEPEDDKIPDWFKRAQAKARRNSDDDKVEIQRSQFADALDAAAARSAWAAGNAKEEAESTAPSANNLQENASAEDARIVDVQDSLAHAQASQSDSAPVAEESAAFEPAQQQAPETIEDHSDQIVPIPFQEEFATAVDDEANAEAQNILDDEIEDEDDNLFEESDFLDTTISMPALNLQNSIPVLQALQPIVLPEISQSFPAIETVTGQPAPLAAQALPTVDLPSTLPAQPVARSSRASLLASLPTFDTTLAQDQLLDNDVTPMDVLQNVPPAPAPAANVIPFQAAVASQPAYALNENTLPSIGSFAGTAGMTGSFAPVGEQIRMSAQGEDLYIEDADDSVYEENYTEQGAYAGQDYVEMPKKKGFFGKLRKGKKKKQAEVETSTQEWLDVDSDYTANSAGAARGSWDSFQPTQAIDPVETLQTANQAAFEQAYPMSQPMDQPINNFDDFTQYDPASLQSDSFDFGESLASQSESWEYDSWNNRGWNGGAFSGMKQKLGKGKKNKQQNAPAQEYGYEDMPEDANGAMYDYEEQPYVEDQMPIEEQQRARGRVQNRIRNFRKVNLDTEVWFVALGSQLSGNAGMKAFLAKHEKELRGALVVELEGLGAGALSYANKEGLGKPVEMSNRPLRFLKNAEEVTGVRTHAESFAWRETASSLATRKGMGALHLVGVMNGKPAYYGEKDDVLDAIDEGILIENADFVMELLKSI